MSLFSTGPFSYNRFDEMDKAYNKLYEKKAAKDYDGDGKVESGKEEYFGSKDKAIKKAMGKEETEYNYVNSYLSELSKKTMGSYIAKGAKDLADRRFDQGDSEKRKYDPDEKDEKEDKKLDKREQGIARAAKKITKEDSEYNYVNTYLDELKKTTMGSYIAKASKDLADRRFDQGDSEKRKYDPDEADEKEDKKLDKREQGIARAAKKITKEHHQKDADGKVIEHDDTTPSSVEEQTVLEQLAENNRDIDAFEAVVSYLIDEKLAESWERAEEIMTTLKPELVQEIYQNQLWTLFDENYRAMRNPEKYKPDDESDKPYRERSKAARMKDPHRGINSPAFKKFMADRGMSM